MKIPAITKLGGRQAVVEHLHSLGHERINERGVRGWQARGRVPGYAILALTKLANERGIPLSPSDFEAEDAA